MPPVPGRARVPWWRIALRRGLALAGLLGLLGALAWLVTAAFRDGGDETPATTARAVVAPPPKPLRIVFPEGFTRDQMAARITAVDRIAKRKRGVQPRLSAKRYLAATARSPVPPGFAKDAKRGSLEGFLFPATYDFTLKTTSAQLLASQLKAFRRNWSKLNLSYARTKNLTPYDVLIIASLVEREVRVPEERAKVSAVIYNRLKAGIPLGIDASIRYALRVPPTQSLRQSQLEDPTPYNTRVHTGLTPTPIGNPGLASMRAAARPAKVDYLYFVRKPDKIHHFFTSSFTEFQNYANAHGY